MRASLEAEADDLGAEALYAGWPRWIRWPPRASSPANVRRTIRALEVTAISGAPFSAFAAAWDRYDADRVRPAGIRLDREAQRARIARGASLAMLEDGWLDEVQA